MGRNKSYPITALALAVVIGMPLGGGLLAGQAGQPEADQAGAGQAGADQPEADQAGAGQPGAAPPENEGQQDEQRSTWLLLPVMITGMATLGVFAFRMSRGNGIGPYDLKAVGIVLIATIVGLLVAHGGDVPSSAATILGAIAGYLFGTKTDPPPPKPTPPKPTPPKPTPPKPTPPSPTTPSPTTPSPTAP